MELSTAYSTVVLCGDGGEPIKYHLATSEEIKPWVEQANSVTDDAGTSHPDHFFADWLQDRGDPRHTIVRKDLELRGLGPSEFNENLNKKAIELTGVQDREALQRSDSWTKIVTPPEGGNRVTVRKFNGLNSVYRVNWNIPTRNVVYQGLFTPEEFQQFLSDYGSNQKLKDFD